MKIIGITRHMKNRIREHGDDVEIVRSQGNKDLLRHTDDDYLGWRIEGIDYKKA